MRSQLLCLAIAAAPLAAGACKKSAPAAEPPAADNTARNSRDVSPSPTADQGAQGGSDLKLTQAVRQAIVKDGALSTNAHNVKIVVDHGTVTLVGPVASADERVRVQEIATSVPGAQHVVNQLEIAN
jgi:hyperosmotically inducible protein